jgi:Domain of unknown function (DUF6089)
MKIRFIVITFFVSFISFCGNSQKFKLPKLFGKEKGTTQWYGEPVKERVLKNNYNIYSTVGFGGGTSNYYGDFTSYKYFLATVLTGTRFNLSANYTKHFSYNFAARIAFSMARIAGDDNNFKEAVGPYLDKYSRGLHFRNDLKEISLSAIYDFTKYRRGGFQMRPKFTPFVFAGFALANHNPKARGAANQSDGKISKDWIKLRDFETEKQGALAKKQYSTIAFSIPFGGGIRYKIADQWDLTFEGGLRYTINSGGKYLDDVSGKYISTAGTSPSPSLSESLSYRAKELYAARTGELRDASKIILPKTTSLTVNEGAKRGNGRQDWYFLTILQLNYYIPTQIKCRVNN